MAGQSDLSYIDIGYFRSDGMRDPTDLKMIDILPNNYWWAQTVTAIKFNEDAIYELGGHEAGFTDSGTSCLIVPNQYFEWLYERLRYDYGMQYTSENMQQIYLNACDSDTISSLPIIWLLFGGYWFQTDPEDYIIEFSE